MGIADLKKGMGDGVGRGVVALRDVFIRDITFRGLALGVSSVISPPCGIDPHVWLRANRVFLAV